MPISNYFDIFSRTTPNNRAHHLPRNKSPNLFLNTRQHDVNVYMNIYI